MIPFDADFSKYKVLVAPVLYMVKGGLKEALTHFVENGGILITTFMSGLVDQSDNVYLGGYPGPLKDLAGIWVEEIDALAPEQTNRIVFADGTEDTCRMLCDVIHLEGAQCLATYASNFYANTPAVTKNSFGKGITYYVGTNLSTEGLNKVLEMLCTDAGLSSVIEENTELEVTCRKAENCSYYFLFNFKDKEIPLPSCFAGCKDLLTGETIPADTVMNQYDTFLISFPH